ncbi:MAG: ABC transporter ATP-binding protein [Holophaga sp.]
MSLVIRDLEIRRHDGVPLLGPLDLDLAAGERLALVGESGSGKSLLVQAIFGLLPSGVHQTGGWVEAFDVRMDIPTPERAQIRSQRLAWIPQEPLAALNPLVRLQDHLTLLPRTLRMDPLASVPARMEQLLQRLGLPLDPAFLRRYPLEISGGQRQRVVLAMALSCNPELLILDEPTSALDPSLQEDFLKLLEGFRQERGLGWLWITHDLEVVAAMADRAMVLYGGHAVEAGPARPLLEQPRHPYTRRLREAHHGLPSTETGFLDAPDRRDAGCPFLPRCPHTRAACVPWLPWQGNPSEGIRCNLV